ncbi:MAG: hypothetical protein WAO55_09720 [Candidatus Manganitrophaceae bacterium]
MALLQDPNQQLQPNAAFTPEIRNLTVPSFEANRTFGVELLYQLNQRNAFLTTLNVWDSEKTANDLVPQLTAANQAIFFNVPRSSRYDLSITQIWLGWRHYFFIAEKDKKENKSRLYLDIGLIGGSYGQMTVDTLLRVTDPIVQSFPVTSSLEANGWGLTSRWGLGADFFLKKWLALSFRVAYIIGRIPKLRVRRFFPSGFSSPPVPEANTDLQPRPEEGETITYGNVARGDSPVREVRSDVQTLPLELNGLEVMAGIHFYF